MVDDDYRLERVTSVPSRLSAEAQLLHAVFRTSSIYTQDYLHWQYFQNPDGDAIGFDAYAGGDLAAHYVVIPFMAHVCGRLEKGALSLNTATHSAHQGRGLFIRLAEATYAAARVSGCKFIVGIANANSTPGFLRKLKFQLVSPLEAHVGVGAVRLVGERQVEFRRYWSDAAKQWRLANPSRRYFTRHRRLYSTTTSPLIKMQLTTSPWGAEVPISSPFSPLSAWIGLNPEATWRGISLPIPKRWRPSPLNFIFRDLTDESRQLAPSSVVVDAVDFDAY